MNDWTQRTEIQLILSFIEWYREIKSIIPTLYPPYKSEPPEHDHADGSSYNLLYYQLPHSPEFTGGWQELKPKEGKEGAKKFTFELQQGVLHYAAKCLHYEMNNGLSKDELPEGWDEDTILMLICNDGKLVTDEIFQKQKKLVDEKYSPYYAKVHPMNLGERMLYEEVRAEIHPEK